MLPSTLFCSPPLPQSPPRRRRFLCVCSAGVPRRDLLRILAVSASAALLPGVSQASTKGWNDNHNARPSSAEFSVFSVIPTSMASVNLMPVTTDEAISDAANCRAVFLGEHHNSLVDHVLQAKIINALRQKRKVMVGLEMIQQQFQPALDSYVSGEIDELELYFKTEWDTQWVWPYESYLPVLRLCRERRIPLVALSMNSEILNKVKGERGIENLSVEEMKLFIGNPDVFAAISREPAFKNYISECITPSYASHYRMGLLRETTNFNSFYTARVLVDEAMATRAVKAIRQNPNALMICLVGGDHVKFEYGVKRRVQQQLFASEERDVEIAITERMAVDNKREEKSMKPLQSELPRIPPIPQLRTIMLNPGPADAYDSKNNSLKLEMDVGSNPIPISDYLWFSSVSDAKPRKRVRSRQLPPVEELTNW